MKRKRTARVMVETLYPEKLYLNNDEVALLLGISPIAVRHLVERGQIPYRKWQKRVIFVRKELEEFLEALPGMRPADVRKRWGL